MSEYSPNPCSATVGAWFRTMGRGQTMNGFSNGIALHFQ